MAGNRRRDGRPKTIDNRIANRLKARPTHLAMVAEAATPSLRVAAATHYLRSALHVAPAEQADQVADQLVRDVIAAADALLKPRRTDR